MLVFDIEYKQPHEVQKGSSYGRRGRLQMVYVKCDNCKCDIAEFRQPSMTTEVINKLTEEIFCSDCIEEQNDGT